MWKTFGWWSMRRGSYDEDFHTYALEWDEDFMYVFAPDLSWEKRG